MDHRETYAKPALTFDEQIDRLTERGMQIPDRDDARHALAHLNYYRLCAYWLPFEADHASHAFRPGTDFQRVLELYEFDRALRLLLMDAIERVEISVRTRLAYVLGHAAGAHAHEDPACFRNAGWQANNLNKLREELERSDEEFVSHYQATYHTPETPPIWASCEIMSFGLLSRFLKSLHVRHRQAIASGYGLPEAIFPGLTHHLSYVRNLCAHHARVWNREFTITPAQPHRRPTVLRDSLVAEAGGGRAGQDPARRVYNTLTFLGYLMRQVAPGDDWVQRTDDLIERHAIDRAAMGFPPDYRDRPIWPGP